MSVIKERTIEGAWRAVLWACARHGYSYRVKRGSYEGEGNEKGQLRKQLDYLNVIIEEPFTRPLAVTLPEHLGIPAPTDNERIEKYFYEYLITDTKTDKEDYTYGQYVSLQVPLAIEMLNYSRGHTNQACITVGTPESIILKDPPCLRIIDFKVVDGRLDMSVFFRSWDLFAGFPENIGGLQLLKEYVIMHLDFPVTDGKLIAYSSGAHIYEQYFPIVNQLNAHKCEVKYDKD